jgi:hypothetical protein
MKHMIERKAKALANEVRAIRRCDSVLGKNLTQGCVVCLQQVRFFLDLNKLDEAKAWLKEAEEAKYW